MRQRSFPLIDLTVMSVALLLTACTRPADDPDYPPLVPRSSQTRGAPDPQSIPSLGKADAIYPAKHHLLDTQSAVRSQGQRGACTFFATTALVEHLHLREGTATKPLDLSEQFAIWLVKKVGKKFADSDGSNTRVNLEVFSEQGGLVDESLWRYDGEPWGREDDPACDSAPGGLGSASGLPLRCYTQGDPPTTVNGAARYGVGKPLWMPNSPAEIKFQLFVKKRAVIVDMPVHCQAWNYRTGCALPTSRDRYELGVIAMPEPHELQAGEPAAGHAMLIVGWDDDYELQKLGRDGRPLVDESGAPVIERGFYIVKNSWGTQVFGKNNPYGAGYGLLSQAYVEAKGQLLTAPIRETPEICDDGEDNDDDGAVDCGDEECAAEPHCARSKFTFYANKRVAIPDDATRSVISPLDVSTERTADRIELVVLLDHPDPSQLTIGIGQKHGQRFWVWDRQRELGSDGQKKQPGEQTTLRFFLGGFSMETVKGPWELEVKDAVRGDAGSVLNWGITVYPCSDDACSNGHSFATNYDQELAIPDGDPAGIQSPVVVPVDHVQEISVGVSLEHPAGGELSLFLLGPGEIELPLLEVTGADGPFISRELTLGPYYFLQARGQWSLKVVDNAANGKSGRLLGWDMMWTTFAGNAP